MATTCPRCGASLAASAQFCAACGQSTVPAPPKAAAPPPVAASAKRMPIAALVVLLGGLVVLIAAFWLYQSGGLPGMGGSAAPVSATPGVPSDPGAPTPASADATTPPVAAPTGAEPAPAPGTAPPAGAVLAAPPLAVPAAAAAPAAPPPPPPPPPFEKTYETRKYAAFKIDPDTAIVTVDGEIIGIADEWADTPRTKKYEFEKEGVHYVKLSHRDYKTIWLRFKVSDKADDKTVEVELEMKKGNDKDAKDEKKEDDKKKDEKKK